MLFLVSLDLLDGAGGSAAGAAGCGSGQVLLKRVRLVKIGNDAGLTDGCGHGERLTVESQEHRAVGATVIHGKVRECAATQIRAADIGLSVVEVAIDLDVPPIVKHHTGLDEPGIVVSPVPGAITNLELVLCLGAASATS